MALPEEVVHDIEARFKGVVGEANNVLSDADRAAYVAEHSKIGEVLIPVAKQLLEVVPQGREAELVLTKLEEVSHWAHQALRRAAGSSGPTPNLAQPAAPAAPAAAPA